MKNFITLPVTLDTDGKEVSYLIWNVAVSSITSVCESDSYITIYTANQRFKIPARYSDMIHTAIDGKQNKNPYSMMENQK